MNTVFSAQAPLNYVDEAIEGGVVYAAQATLNYPDETEPIYAKQAPLDYATPWNTEV